MDPFHCEIIHAPAGRDGAASVRALIEGDPVLRANVEHWTSESIPLASALYILIVIASDDLAADQAACRRIDEIASLGFPVLPIVESCSTYDFERAPLPTITSRNAKGLDNPIDVVDTLLHHGGLRRYGSGGQVMISYARSDGRQLMDALREHMDQAGFRCYVDEREIPGAVMVQEDIEANIERSDLVVLVDSKGASQSSWVADEMDMARAAHVPVVAVTPRDEGFHHALPVPHVPWGAGDDVQAVANRTAGVARRLLASKVVFRERVQRVLDRLCRLRGWQLDDRVDPLSVRPGPALVRVACSATIPQVEAVRRLLELVGPGGKGLVVGGTRPYPRLTAEGLDSAGYPGIRAAPLSRVATRLTDRIDPAALAGCRIFLSASMPDEPKEAEAAKSTLAPFVVTFAQAMVELGVTIVFGGHPSVTPLIHKALRNVASKDSGRVELHQGRYWRIRSELPKEVQDRRVFAKGAVTWHGEGENAEDDLRALRDGMITSGLDGGVFVGGRTIAPNGGRPGIVDEYERLRAACPERPAFVLGLAGGAAKQLIAAGEPPEDLVDPLITDALVKSQDPDLVTALIVAELLERKPRG